MELLLHVGHYSRDLVFTANEANALPAWSSYSSGRTGKKWSAAETACTAAPPGSLLENPVDRGAWRAAVHGATKSQPGLSD